MNKDLVRQIFPEQVENFENKQCSTCGRDMSKPQFRDLLSVKEYQISGMCQSCQDGVFGEYDERTSDERR